MRSSRTTLAVLMLVSSTSVALADNANVQFTPIGSPPWEPTDAHLFTAPIGTPADGFAEFQQSFDAIVPPNQGPVSPPYTNILVNGLASAGFRQGSVFSSTEFSFPNAVLALSGVLNGSRPTVISPLVW